MSGYEGDNTLDGGNGNDRFVVISGNSRDVLTGGSGKDIFWFNSTDYGSIITDFSVAEDTIRTIFTVGLGREGTIKPEQFRLGSSARDLSDRFIYNPGTGALFFDRDGTGSTKQELFAQLQPDLAMTYRDFFVENI